MVNSQCEAGSAIQLAIPISYPTRVNGIFVLLNCQPSLISTFTKHSLLLKRIQVIGWSEFTAITVALVFHKQLYG